MLQTTPGDQISESFVSRGLALLGPADLGLDPAVHRSVYEQELAAFRAKQAISVERVPDILKVLEAPGLVRACDQLLGPDWAILPFTHNAPFASGAFDQHWHKDDNGPWNGRWQRHHHPIQIELLYYPQAVDPDMGPTAVVPGSQYWTFNHETNQDNFAGADHLDFEYQLEGMERVPVSGPRSAYDDDAVRAGRTDHDLRMRRAVEALGWPLTSAFEVAPIEAGSVLLYSHNLIHRGNHRRDAFERWRERPRFMWRFWLYRTRDPKPAAGPHRFRLPTKDLVTGARFSSAPAGVLATWQHHLRWLESAQFSPGDLAGDVDALQLRQTGDSAEVDRIGAAYQLADLTDRSASLAALEEALQHERENVRRAATVGLIAIGEAATPVFLRACAAERRWLRRAGAHGLGDAGTPDLATVQPLARLLAGDPSAFVRSVAAHALGCLARRAAQQERSTAVLGTCAEALLAGLEREPNRLAMNLAQGRSIKFVRPNDDSDVCEGMGIRFEGTSFQPVRSAVRENALWSLVILCTHADSLPAGLRQQTEAALEGIVHSDANVFCHGLALDALIRLRGGAADSPLDASPVHSWEPLLRAGLSREAIESYLTEHPSNAEHALRFDLDPGTATLQGATPSG